MVENLLESTGMCTDGPGSAPIEIPKEGVLSWERARERWKDEALVGLEKKGIACLTYSHRPWSHQCATHADSPRRTRGQSVRCAYGPAPRRGRYVICTRTSNTAPLTHKPRGRSAPHRRTVRQVQSDSPAHWVDSPFSPLFYFSLIYSEIKIWISIFWDHCSRIMKETCHMMQCSYHARKLCEK
jgi:hypothetical protein